MILQSNKNTGALIACQVPTQTRPSTMGRVSRKANREARTLPERVARGAFALEGHLSPAGRTRPYLLCADKESPGARRWTVGD